MLLSNSSVSEILGKDGPFADYLGNFAPREEQQHLATAVFDALQSNGVLVGEAGTGIGKTFAYLVPAMISGQRVIVSTGTRHLQDQLFHKDIPVVKRALDLGLTASLLKGRANYLCRHRLIRAIRNPLLRDAKYQNHLASLMEWSRQTKTGDKAEVRDVPEDSLVWGFVTSNDEFCSRHEFEEQKDCFVFDARKRAQAAEVVVVNHHLLCADLALKEEGFGELLPSANAFVIDEAHQLPEVAANFFGKKLSSKQLNDLATDITGDQLTEAPDMPELRDGAQRLESAVRHFRLAFGVDPSRDAWRKVCGENAVERELEHLENALDALLDLLGSIEGRGKGLDSCRRRCAGHRETLRKFSADSAGSTSAKSGRANGTPDAHKADAHEADAHDAVAHDAVAHEAVAGEAVAGEVAAAAAIDKQDAPNRDERYIHWFETYRTGFSLNMTPMNVAAPFQQAMQAMPASWVFTSATLAVGGDFSHFKNRLGLTATEELQVDSPFNYTDNALLYLPQGLPEPGARGYTLLAMEKILPILQASRGRAFVLFTSHRAMHEAEPWLKERLDFPILRQGQSPKHELLEAFQSIGNAVLLGTSSFWEGVDVRGEALSCVVIDKLPFGSPGDPVMSARIHAMNSSGGNAFFEYQVPQAAISLKQGVGRLIRDVSDTGVLVLCDPRIQTREYGQIFRDSLPPMPVSDDLDEVEQFFDHKDALLQQTIAEKARSSEDQSAEHNSAVILSRKIPAQRNPAASNDKAE